MNLSAPFIRRPVMTTLLMIGLLYFGIQAYSRLAVSDLPNIDYPTIHVQTSFPGAGAETVASTVTKTLEKQFMTIGGVSTIHSSSRAGQSMITINFDLDKDMNVASQEVSRAIDNADLPADLPQRPQYTKQNPSAEPILYITLSSETLEAFELSDFAEHTVAQQLSAIKGVANVAIYGSKYAMRVEADPEQLALNGLEVRDVKRAISASNTHLPGGTLSNASTTLTIQPQGGLTTPEEFQNIIVRQDGQSTLRLGDIATVRGGLEREPSYSRLIKQGAISPAATLAIQKQPGSNTIRVAKSIHEALSKIRKELPRSVELEVIFDRSALIEDSVAEVKETLIVALVLVILVIFIYLGSLKDTLIPALTIPLSLVGTFGAMFFLGYSIDNLSLLALTLAIGFVVDDAIVVMENIFRKREEGMSAVEAAIEGSKQISFTVLSMTLSLIAVFIPLLFLGGILGKLFREFSVTLATAVLLSGIISLSLTPMLLSRMRHTKAKSQIADRLNAFLLSLYRPLLKRALNYQKTTLLLFASTTALTGYLFSKLPMELMPQDDSGYVVAWMQTPDGTSMAKTIEKVREANTITSQNPHIVSMLSAALQNNGAFAFIALKPHGERPPIKEVIAELQKAHAPLTEVGVYMHAMPALDIPFERGARGQSYSYLVKSPSYESLKTGVRAMEKRLSNHEMFSDVSAKLDKELREVSVSILRDKTASLGIDVAQIQDTLRTAFSGQEVSRILTPQAYYPVKLTLLPEYRDTPEALSKIYLRSPKTSQLIPLSALTHVDEVMAPNTIRHFNQNPSAHIQFNLKEGISLDQAITELERIGQEVFPENVSATTSGTTREFEAYSKQFRALIVMAIFVMYLILGILYESFIDPLTILSSLPIAGLGAALTLLYFGQPLSLYGFIGLILLLGIVKKNGIMIVDQAKEILKTTETDPKTAVYEACLIRFRPIMMTTFAAVFGALPIAIGMGVAATGKETLGLVIVGGLTFSQVFTLIFTPVIFLSFQRLKRV